MIKLVLNCKFKIIANTGWEFKTLYIIFFIFFLEKQNLEYRSLVLSQILETCLL